MKYRVKLTAAAHDDIDAAYFWLAERTSHAATWFNGLEDAIEGLAELPTRWQLARESVEVDEPIRQLLYGKTPHIYRVLFVVREKTVHVLHVRHGARQTLKRDEIVLPSTEDLPG